MKNIPRLIAIVLIAGFAPIARAEDTLRIATFNCEFLSRNTVHVKFGLPLFKNSWTQEDRDRWEVLGDPEDLFKLACEHVAKVIKKIDADVIALTEVGPEADVEELHRAVQDAGLSYAYRQMGSGTFNQYVAAWSRRELSGAIKPIPGREFYDTELDDAEAEDDTGLSKSLHVTFQAGGKTIHFYAYHLKSERGGHESDGQRVAQASIARRHYLHFLNQRQEPGADPVDDNYVIVAGDLNDGPGQPTLRRIRGRDDLYGDLIQTWHTPYFHDRSKWDGRWSYNYQGDYNRIDHILPSYTLTPLLLSQTSAADPKGITAEVLEVTEMIPSGKKVSDHRPFIVTLRFR